MQSKIDIQHKIQLLIESIYFSYINYSNIAARILRRSLKPEARTEAAKRDESHIKFTPWTNGRPARKFFIVYFFKFLILMIYLLNYNDVMMHLQMKSLKVS